MTAREEGLPLWLLERHSDLGWEECHAQIVAAPDELNARRIAAENAYGEGSELWLPTGDQIVATCDQIAAASTYESPCSVMTKTAS